MLRADLGDLVGRIAGPSGLAVAGSPTTGPTPWRDWQIRRVDGGRNARVFRATSQDADLAVKLTLRDRRDRAGREYGSLQALDDAGLEIAPVPLLLESDRYESQAIVMTWLEGNVSSEPPASDDDWRRLVEHLAAIHTVTPRNSRARLADSAYGRQSAADGITRIHRHLDMIPEADRPPALLQMLARLESTDLPSWPPPALALCRSDPNISNIVQRPGPWASVDWEASGWGDPAFEVAELISHAAYLTVPAERWAWVQEEYARLTPDPAVAERIPIYTTQMYASWATRFARMLYEIPRGKDVRLIPWPDDWLDGVRQRYEQYLDLALHVLA